MRSFCLFRSWRRLARRAAWIAALVLLGVFGSATVASLNAEAPTIINLGTLAPNGSAWHKAFQRMGEDWRSATNGDVRLRIFPGGTVGDESAMILKMGIGQLQAVAISNDGLADIEPDAFALMLPLTFDTYAEWDYVRARINPLLEERFEEKGFVVLTWSDIGWVHFFTKEPLQHPDQLKTRKLAASPTATKELEIFKSLGLNPVPTTTIDLVPSLQRGRIDSLYLPIIVAAGSTLYTYAKNMTDLKWAPLQGALLIDKRVWEGLGVEQQQAIRRISREVGEELRASNREHERRSLEVMVGRGLRVWEVDAETRNEWRSRARATYPQVRGNLVDAVLFDTVLRLLDEYRQRQDGPRRP